MQTLHLHNPSGVCARRALMCAIILFGLIASSFVVSERKAYAEGVVPESALAAYPGMDPRLVGVPIVKTDMTASLVAYSEAVAHVNTLIAEKATLLSNVDILSPEKDRAKTELDSRTEELDRVTRALQDVVLMQYQDLSDDKNEDDTSVHPDEMRVQHQAARVADTLGVWKIKAQKRKVKADKYFTQITNAIANSQKRVDELASELTAAQNAAAERKDVVRSGIPAAAIVGLDIPVLTMDAYLRAEKFMATDKPECGITWWMLAGIGRAESNHGRYHGALLNEEGTVTPSIIGVPLNGNGFAAIGDSDGGKYDGDTQWDRAVGVMQFIPGTWNRWGSDGNGDGATDPQNVYDAALAAAKYLCAAASPDMKSEAGRRDGFMSYNHSDAYVDFVAKRGHEYEAQGAGRFNPAPVDETQAPTQ